MKRLFQLFALASLICCFSVPESVAQEEAQTETKTRASAKKDSAKTSKSKKTSKTGKSKKQKSKSTTKSAGRKSAAKKSSRKRLPRYFTHLKLTDQQRDEIGQIQTDYQTRLKELNEQLASLKEEQQEALVDVLTRTQKSLYNEYLDGTKTVGNRIRINSKKASSKKSETDDEDEPAMDDDR